MTTNALPLLKLQKRLEGFLARRRHRKRGQQGPATPDEVFRMLVLNDEPWLTYVGWRAWCNGKKAFTDSSDCFCRHYDDKNKSPFPPLY